MKNIKVMISISLILVVLLFIGCRDWFGEGNQPISIVSIEEPPPAQIDISSPQFGSVWKPGETIPILWATSSTIKKVNIQLYRKSAFQFSIAQEKANDGIFSWDVPEAINHSVHYRIKIINADKPSEYMISKSFAIRD